MDRLLTINRQSNKGKQEYKESDQVYLYLALKCLGPTRVYKEVKPGNSSVVLKTTGSCKKLTSAQNVCAKIIFNNMPCLVFITTLVVVLCYGRLAGCERVSSVAKPGSTQVKYLDYEIGASIHFNMQTFDRNMKPGLLI